MEGSVRGGDQRRDREHPLSRMADNSISPAELRSERHSGEIASAVASKYFVKRRKYKTSPFLSERQREMLGIHLKLARADVQKRLKEIGTSCAMKGKARRSGRVGTPVSLTLLWHSEGTGNSVS